MVSLLLLGTKWWDSEARYRFVAGVGARIQPAIEEVESRREEEAVLREKRWVRIRWEEVAVSDAGGWGVGYRNCVSWVLGCDINMHGVLEEGNIVPADAGRVSLARSIDEQYKILKKMGAQIFGGLEEYEGRTTS